MSKIKRITLAVLLVVVVLLLLLVVLVVVVEVQGADIKVRLGLRPHLLHLPMLQPTLRKKDRQRKCDNSSN